MPFGLSYSRSSKSSRKNNIIQSQMDSGRFNMSGLFHDGLKSTKPSKSQKSPIRNDRKQQQQQQQVQMRQHQQQQQVHMRQQQQQQRNNQQRRTAHQSDPPHHYSYNSSNSMKFTPPRSRNSSGPLRPPSPSPLGADKHQRSRSNNRYPPHQYQQVMQPYDLQQQGHQAQHQRQQQHQQQHYDNMVINTSHSNNSHGSRHSTHSKQGSNSFQKPPQQHHHRRSGSNASAHSPSSNASSRFHSAKQHNRTLSANSELGSVHSLPIVTSRSSNSDPSNHSRRSLHSNSHANSNTAEHRDPHGETTNTRRTLQTASSLNSQFHTPQRPIRTSSASGAGFLPVPTPLQQSNSHSPVIKPTPAKSLFSRDNASVGSSRSILSYHSSHGGPWSVGGGKSVATTTSVSKDKHVIKATKKIIEDLKKSCDVDYPSEKRIVALTNACAEFDHLDESRHNMELQQGVAVVLCRLLGMLLNSADSAGVDEEDDYGISFDNDDYNEPQISGSDSNVSEAKSNDRNDSAKSSEELTTKSVGTVNLDPILSAESDNLDDSLRMIATALEKVFRGQAVYVSSAYDKCGSKTKYEGGIVGLLLRLLNRAEGLHHRYHMKPHNADAVMVNATKVLLYLSRVPELRVRLTRQPGVLDFLSRVSRPEMYDSKESPEHSKGNTKADARVARVRIITNLVNEEENKTLVLAHKVTTPENASGSDEGILDALLRVAHMDPDDRGREYAGMALMDLASAPSNQVPMTNNEQLLGTLVKMILLETNPGTREAAITALQNLAFSKENRIRLVTFKRGVILEALMRALANTSKDFHEKSRRRSAGALTNLACDESAEFMGKHKGLLHTLSMVSTKDESPEVQTRAAMALTKLASSITIRMDTLTNQQTGSEDKDSNGSEQSNTSSVYSTLLDALVVASLSPVTNSVSAVLRVKARDPENRYRLATHPGILDTLADMCLYDNNGRIVRARSYNGRSLKDDSTHTTNYAIDVVKDRDNATRALMHLTNESKNRIILCTPAILNALVRGASITDDQIATHAKPQQLVDIRDSAIRAIERLATEFSNRHTMAHHEGMIVAIARATEREARLERSEQQNGSTKNLSNKNGKDDFSVSNSVDGSSLALTPRRHSFQSQQHARLAKPLLMSLLVAM